MNTIVTNSVASRPRHAKTTAAIGSGSPHLRYWTGMRSQPTETEKEKGKLNYVDVRFFIDSFMFRGFPGISLLSVFQEAALVLSVGSDCVKVSIMAQ